MHSLLQTDFSFWNLGATETVPRGMQMWAILQTQTHEHFKRLFLRQEMLPAMEMQIWTSVNKV